MPKRLDDTNASIEADKEQIPPIENTIEAIQLKIEGLKLILNLPEPQQYSKPKPNYIIQDQVTKLGALPSNKVMIIEFKRQIANIILKMEQLLEENKNQCSEYLAKKILGFSYNKTPTVPPFIYSSSPDVLDIERLISEQMTYDLSTETRPNLTLSNNKELRSNSAKISMDFLDLSRLLNDLNVDTKEINISELRNNLIELLISGDIAVAVEMFTNDISKIFKTDDQKRQFLNRISQYLIQVSALVNSQTNSLSSDLFANILNYFSQYVSEIGPSSGLVTSFFDKPRS